MLLPELASFASAMLFAVHPIHTEAVSTAFNASINEIKICKYISNIKISYLVAVKPSSYENIATYKVLSFHQIFPLHLFTYKIKLQTHASIKA